MALETTPRARGPKIPFSMREGLNPNAQGFSLKEINELFLRLYKQLNIDGYTHESFGFWCVDEHDVPGKIADVEFDMLMSLRKKNLWPLEACAPKYKEDDLFDVIEYLFERVSKPIDGRMHTYDNCGMHWDKFDKAAGQREFRRRINELLSHYAKRFELSADGQILRGAPRGYETIFNAEVPTTDKTIEERVAAATLLFRRHGSSLDDRRHAVADLAGVLEALRPKLKAVLTSKDEADLFNIANNFLIRHQNDKQKGNYDRALWLSWMFYLYLSTIHLVLRKLEGPKAITD